MKKATYIFLLKNDDKQSSSELARPTSSLWHFLVSWLLNNQPPPRLADCNIAREQERGSPWFRHPWNQEWNGLLHHALIKCRCPFFSKWECPDSGCTYVFVTNGITVLLIHKAFLVIFSTTNSDCKEMNLSHYSDTHSLTTLYFFYHMNTVTDWTKADQMKIGYEISVQLVQLSMSSSISLF